MFETNSAIFWSGYSYPHVGLGHVVVGEQQLEREDRDPHQDQDRDNRPDHFDHRVVAPLGGNRVRLLIVADHDPDQQAQHQQGDGRDDRQQDRVVEEDRVVPQGRDARLQVDRARRGLADSIRRLR
jgi:hypothetical protein